jgi:hypothetical protein
MKRASHRTVALQKNLVANKNTMYTAKLNLYHLLARLFFGVILFASTPQEPKAV